MAAKYEKTKEKKLLKFSLLVLFLLGLLLFSGCIGSKKPPSSAFVGGKDGLVASFESPQDQVIMSVPFDIILRVQNKGECPIPTGSANFTLNNPSLFGVGEPTKHNNENLSETKLRGENVVSEGGVELITWSANISTLIVTEQQQIPINVVMSYPYNTTSVVYACTSTSGKVCQPTEEKQVQNSGAPIRIKSFKQTAIKTAEGIRLRFGFILENVGGGTVSSDQSFSESSINQVNITSIKFGNRIYDSSNITSICGASTFATDTEYWCTLQDVPEEIEDQLVFNISYYYQQSVSKTISLVT